MSTSYLNMWIIIPIIAAWAKNKIITFNVILKRKCLYFTKMLSKNVHGTIGKHFTCIKTPCLLKLK